MQFGFCNPPEPKYIYIKSDKDESGDSYLWYFYEIENKKAIPISQRGLRGMIRELRLTSKEFKGKDNMKLDIVFAAGDDTYILRTGVETFFAKTFLNAIAIVKDLTKPLIIAVAPGEENVVFCRLYNALNNQRYKAEWDKNADFAGIIAEIQRKLEQPQQPKEQFAIQPPPELNRADVVVEVSRIDLIHEIDRLMTDRGISRAFARDWCKSNLGVATRADMSIDQLEQFKFALEKTQSPTAAVEGF